MATKAIAAEELIRQGKPAEALDKLKDAIRQDPSDPAKRVFLFQLLCVLGDWDKALTQASVASDLDGLNQMLSTVGRSVIQCEAFRREVFAGNRSPLLLGEPAPWVGMMVQACGMTARGQHRAAGELRAQAFEDAPAVAGRITVHSGDQAETTEFAWAADADERLGPMIELMLEGKYYWVPMSHIASIDVEPPQDLRDAVWTPVSLRWVNGGDAMGLIPTRYPGSEIHDDYAIRMSRRTEFVDLGDEMFVVFGQRMWATDVGEFPIMQTRRIEFDHPQQGEDHGRTDSE
ncbi:MAG: tetratricopeptide repeat protein [Phycisphaeraceae bacterium]|nr:tetratricopeptide repeat protein [Phycisphaeraceae bacterium]MCW5763373.1 tetratricopeptide repeat protein [Phycisphaeraceae bacterium]